MIEAERFVLDNGLKVLVNKDINTPFVAVNLLYQVGARNENPNKTGFAHLFEHLMFGGSVNIDNYETPLQLVGGSFNAFTNNDFTNYHLVVPKSNLETGFWLESDRMLSLAFTEKSLEVQRNVVIEEFKQNYLNQPYGDVWLLLRPLAYKKHPYQWPTIGKEPAHIEQATMQDVRNFFFTHYAPDNAIMAVSGNVDLHTVKELTNKWFASIERRNPPQTCFPIELPQNEARKLHVTRDVPYDAIYKAYHMVSRQHADYHTTDLISDILSNGMSSRLYQKLVKEKELFNSISAYIMGSLDEGLFVISGKIAEGVSMNDAEAAINSETELLMNTEVSEYELNKVKNKIEAMLVFSEIGILSKAQNLAYAEMLGDYNLVNTEVEKYRKVSVADIQRVARKILCPENCSTLYYHAKKEQ